MSEQERMSADELQELVKSGKLRGGEGKAIAPPLPLDLFEDNDAAHSLTIEINAKAPSLNNAYFSKTIPRARGLGRYIGRELYFKIRDLLTVRVKTKEAEAFKELVRSIVAGRKIRKAMWYEISVTFYGQLHNKSDGEPKKWDGPNKLKLLEDAMCEALGFDDKRIIDHHLRKRDGPDGATATIKVWEGKKWE